MLRPSCVDNSQGSATSIQWLSSQKAAQRIFRKLEIMESFDFLDLKHCLAATTIRRLNNRPFDELLLWAVFHLCACRAQKRTESLSRTTGYSQKTQCGSNWFTETLRKTSKNLSKPSNLWDQNLIDQALQHLLKLEICLMELSLIKISPWWGTGGEERNRLVSTFKCWREAKPIRFESIIEHY